MLFWSFASTVILSNEIFYHIFVSVAWWCCGVVVITTAQPHSAQPELKFCAGSNPVHSVSEISDGEDL